MTPDIERLAKEAGARSQKWLYGGRDIPTTAGNGWFFTGDQLALFAALMAYECANIANITYEGSEGGSDHDSGFTFYGENSAAAIRAKFALSSDKPEVK